MFAFLEFLPPSLRDACARRYDFNDVDDGSVSGDFANAEE
jgi:hypothetical protein